MNLAEFNPDVVVDARNCILGRVASQVAERALDGDRIAVVNAEAAVVTGDEEATVESFRERAAVGSDRGPAYPTRPDGMLRRSIRGMVPHKRQRGRAAMENVRVYVGQPFEEETPEVLSGTSLDRLSNIRFIQLGDIADKIGANRTW